MDNKKLALDCLWVLINDIKSYIDRDWKSLIKRESYYSGKRSDLLFNIIANSCNVMRYVPELNTRVFVEIIDLSSAIIRYNHKTIFKKRFREFNTELQSFLEQLKEEVRLDKETKESGR